MFQTLRTFYKGKKSYILAGLLVAYAIGGVSTGHMDMQTALELLFSSGVISSLRASIASHQHAVNTVIETLQVANQMSQQGVTAIVQPEASAPEVTQ